MKGRPGDAAVILKLRILRLEKERDDLYDEVNRVTKELNDARRGCDHPSWSPCNVYIDECDVCGIEREIQDL